MVPKRPVLDLYNCLSGDNVACQPFPRDYSGYGFATSNYDKAYCASHINAYDKQFRNATHTFKLTNEDSARICETSEPSRLWQNIIPSIFLLIAFANYIPSFISNTFLRDQILSYLLFIKHTVDQGYGDLERIMKYANRVQAGAGMEEEDKRFQELEKQCFKWRGNDLSQWYFGLNFFRLLILIGEILLFSLWDPVRIDEIRQDFICCVDRQHPVQCTFSKYYILLIFWLVTVTALGFSVLITMKGIMSIFFEIPCECKLCRHHTLNICKKCSRSWCEEHGDGCAKCGECRCKSDCKSHVYSRICGSRIACEIVAEESEKVAESSANVEQVPVDVGGEQSAHGVEPVVVGGDSVELTFTDAEKRRQSLIIGKPRVEPEDENRCCLQFPMDYHFISHLCYANSHAMKLLMIVNVMDHLAGTISDERRAKQQAASRYRQFFNKHLRPSNT